MVGNPTAPIEPHHEWSAGWRHRNAAHARLHSGRKARRPHHVHRFLYLENPCRLRRRIRSPQERRIGGMITHIKFVSIPTRNQDAALAFYTERLGFKLVTDQPHDDKQRWIELRIGGSDTRFVLFTMDETQIGSTFNGALACDNVEKTYRELKERGVKFLTEPQQQEWGTFAMFEDPDGNKFLLSPR